MRKTMKRLPPEAKGGRVTDPLKEGYLGAEPKASREVNLQAYAQVPRRSRQDRAEGAGTPHRRAVRGGELAQPSEAHWFARGGKCGGCAGKQRVLTWGTERSRASKGSS
jgi:hypothetical protein